MTPRYTWLWTTLALGLFAFIFFFERHWGEPRSGPRKVLPGLDVAAVTNVQVRPAGQFEIRAARINGAWRLTQPLAYPGEATRIEGLLQGLAQLQVHTLLTGADLLQHTNTDVEFGFELPQASVLLQTPKERRQVLIGARTAPGDQVFVQLVGNEEVFVVEADLLKLLPSSADEWRDTALVRTESLVFDRIHVTNASGAFELQRDVAHQSWRLAEPLQARADGPRIEQALLFLQRLRVRQFVTDDSAAELESCGLQPPDLSLTLAAGANPVARLQFGRSPTNNPAWVFARRLDLPTIVTVETAPLSPWRAAHSEFRDRHVLRLQRPLQTIEVLGAESFTLQRVLTNDWRILPLDLPADVDLVEDLLARLSGLQVTEFVKDVVIEPDLPKYGLAVPVREFVFRAVPQATGDTNTLLGSLEFGTTEDGKTYIRRPDETAVYAVKAADFEGLPNTPYQLRERRIWNLNPSAVARLLIQQGGKVRQLLRQGTNSWSLGPGSQGMINSLAVEEAVARLAGLYAIRWAAVGESHLARFGFTPNSLRIALEPRAGDPWSVQFGGTSPSGVTYAATKLEGRVWIFECPPAVSELARIYLAIPADVP